MNILKKLWASAAVKSAAAALVKAVVTAALATLGVTLAGCGALQTPHSKTQSSAVYAFSLPAVVITHDNTQLADGSGGDANTASESPGH